MDPEPHPSPSQQVPYLFSSGPTVSLDFFLLCIQLCNTFWSLTLLNRFNSIWLWLWKLHAFMFRQHLYILSRILAPSFTFCILPFHVSVCPEAPYSPMKTTCHFLLDFLIDGVDCSWAWGWSLNINHSLWVSLLYRVLPWAFFKQISKWPKPDLLQSSSVILWFCPAPSSQDAEPPALTVTAAKPAFNLLINSEFFLFCENKYVVG